MRLFPREMLSLKCKKFLVDALRNQKSEIPTDRIYHGFDKKKRKKRTMLSLQRIRTRRYFVITLIVHPRHQRCYVVKYCTVNYANLDSSGKRMRLVSR